MPLKADIIDFDSMTDNAIVKEIGNSIKDLRLSKNISQFELAQRAGVSRDTVVQLEAGRPAVLLTLVRVLRALENLTLLSAFRVEHPVSPIELLRRENRRRKRASSPRARGNESPAAS